MRKPKPYKNFVVSRKITSSRSIDMDNLTIKANWMAAKYNVPLSSVRVDFYRQELTCVIPEPESEYKKRLKEWEEDKKFEAERRERQREWQKQQDEAARQAIAKRKQEQAANTIEGLSLLIKDPTIKKLVKKMVED